MPSSWSRPAGRSLRGLQLPAALKGVRAAVLGPKGRAVAGALAVAGVAFLGKGKLPSGPAVRVSAPPSTIEEELFEPEEEPSSDDLWLDRMIDKAIDKLRGKR